MKCIENYVERENAGVTKRVEDAQAVVQQDQEDTNKAEIAGLKNRQSEITFQEMMVAIGDSLSDLASSDDGRDEEDEDDEQTAQGHPSKDDESSWVMGTITKTVR